MKTFEEWSFLGKKKEKSKYPPPAHPENKLDPYGEEDWQDRPVEFIDDASIRFFREKMESKEYFISPMRYRVN